MPRACGIKGDLPNPLTMLSHMWHWPSDIRTAMDQFNLGPDLMWYMPHVLDTIACTAPEDKRQSARYPEFCTYQEFVGERRCHARLIHKRESGKPTVALCPFAYQPLESWLAQLLSKPGIIESMSTTASSWRNPGNIWRDIFSRKSVMRITWARQEDIIPGYISSVQMNSDSSSI
jgi:hypothetical protein